MKQRHCSRLAAFLLEPKQEENLCTDIAKCLEMLAAGKGVKTQLCRTVEALILGARKLNLTGDPGGDWTQIKRLLRESDQVEISRIANNLDYLIAFNQGKQNLCTQNQFFNLGYSMTYSSVV